MTLIFDLRKKINKLVSEQTLNYAIVLVLFVQFMVLKWLHLATYGGYLIDVLIIGHIFLHYENYDYKSLLLSFTIALYFLVSFLILGGTLKNTIANLRDAFPALLIIPFTVYLTKNRKEKVDKYLKCLFVPMNIYMVLNMIAIFFEAKGYTWISGIAYAKDFDFTFPLDAMSGLLGIYGQPLLSLFMVFLIIYNFKYAGKVQDKTKRNIITFYNVLITLYSLYISSIYGINLHYALLMMFSFIYFIWELLCKVGINKKTIIFVIISCFLLFGFALAAYLTVPFVRKSISYCFNEVFAGFDYKKAYGSSERLALILYYIYEVNLLIGHGIGYARWTEPDVFGYHHFGISDFGTILCLGGIVIMILYGFLFYRLYKHLFKGGFMKFVLLCATAITMCATQILFSISGISLFLLIIFTLYWNNDKNLI